MLSGRVQAAPMCCAFLNSLAGDSVYQPFEPELDWSRFSLSLPQAEIPRIHEALRAMPLQQYIEMQVREE